MAFDTKKFLVRTGGAAGFVVVLLGCILWNYYSFSALFLVVSMWGLQEYYKLMSLTGAEPNKVLGFIAGTAFYLDSCLTNILLDIFKDDTFALLLIYKSASLL